MKSKTQSTWTKAMCDCCLREDAADVLTAKHPMGDARYRFVRCTDCRRHCPQPGGNVLECHLDHTFGYTA